MQIYVNFELWANVAFLKTTNIIWATSWQNQQNGVLAHHSDQSSLSTRRKLGSLVTLSVQIERRIWSDWANAKADLSLRWAHVFCYDAAHFNTQICKYTNTFLENGIGSLAVLSLNRRVIPISLHVLLKEPIHYHTCKNSCCPSLSKAVSASIYRQ